MTMPSFLELALRRIRKQDVEENVPPVPPPEIIDEAEHPLRFYPGFREFATEWNNHATDAVRLRLQENIQFARSEVEKLPNQSGPLQARIKTLREEQEQQRKIYDIRQGVPKREKFPPLKRANRRLRRAREELERTIHQEQQVRQTVEARLETSTDALVNLDNQFAYGLAEDKVKFYVGERLRNDRNALDEFLLRYCARKGLARDRRESTLWSLNYQFFSLLGYYDMATEKLIHEELVGKANRATRRQLSMRIRESL